jgi:hypothetical protein
LLKTSFYKSSIDPYKPLDDRSSVSDEDQLVDDRVQWRGTLLPQYCI